jgi:hypothetical protein
MEMILTAVFEEVPESEGGGYVAYVEELPALSRKAIPWMKLATTCEMQSPYCCGAVAATS